MPRRMVAKERISLRELEGGPILNRHNKSDRILSYVVNIRCRNGANKTCVVHGIPGFKGVENYGV